MNDQSGYVVAWHIFDRKRYMIWFNGLSERDWFMKIPQTSALLISTTRAELRRKAIKHNITISRQAAQKIDMDRTFRLLEKLRPCEFIPKRTSEIFLETWNALDDLAHSIGDTTFERISRAKYNDKLYQKIFYANELPAVTPKGEHYKAVLSKSETTHIKTLLHDRGTSLLKKSGVID